MNTTFAVFAGLAVLLITLLAMNVSRLRMRERVANGDGGNKVMMKAIRAHMNAVEHLLPYALLVLVMSAGGLPAGFVMAMAYGFLAVRVAHAYSMLAARFRLRQVTAGLTYALELAGCGALLVQAV